MKKIVLFLIIGLFLLTTPVTDVFSASRLSAANITAQNTFSTATIITGYYNFSVSGTWVATVTLQRSYDGGSTWVDLANFTSNVEDISLEPETGVYYRFGVKTGAFTSGTVVGRISQ